MSLVGLGLTGLGIRQDRVGRIETAAFRAVNQLPDALYAPVWLVMQGGSLAAAPAAAAVAYLSGHRPLAGRLLLAGSATWMLAKVVKRGYRRPRPAVLLESTRGRGREQSGLGYVSGHAGVAVALGLQAYPYLGRAGRLATLVAVPVIGASRVYIGAHLPLDTVGGAAVGFAVDALIALGPYDTPRAAASTPC